jgi:alkylation response protein AidB-like acyl-CoA dehydrogenase
MDVRRLPLRTTVTYTIFEGTSEIQRLVVARSISGLHIP